MPVRTRRVEPADATALADLQRRFRHDFAPTEPVRDDSYYTCAGQADAIAADLERWAGGEAEPRVVLDDAGRVVGRANLFFVVRGPLQSCTLGYWIAPDAAGRGLATEAVAELVEYAITDLRLHRIEAGTLVHNLASQQDLAKNGFERIGLARQLVRIAGRWQDHVLFQRLGDDQPEPA